ncbi:MAG: replicative DNA helicase, partial [Verrucomicrobia bacterium]|nr:replicative DNA helicase [Verrucomicrobiota bacterium]
MPESIAGRSLPHSLEAEEHLLSCCLLDGADVVSRCLEARLKAESFYDPKHVIIFGILLDLYNNQKP